MRHGASRRRQDRAAAPARHVAPSARAHRAAAVARLASAPRIRVRLGAARTRLATASRREPFLCALTAAYFAVAAVGIVVPASAEAVAHGRVWLLLTSALAAQGPVPLAQVALAAAVAAFAIGRIGAAAWWRAALAGHVGSALIVYALIGLAGAERAASTPDYGVSCVLGASFGALLTVKGAPRVIGVVGTLALLPLSLTRIGLEHPLSVAIGAAVTAWRRA